MGNPSCLTIDAPLTTHQQAYLCELKRILPKGFAESCPDGKERDFRLLGMTQLALEDFNLMPPQEGATIRNLGAYQSLWPLFTLGTTFYVATFKQMDYTLVDITYSDGGLSINLDRVGKIGAALANIEKMWLRQLQNRKYGLALSNSGMGLGTPRFQSNISKFIGMLGDGAFGWGIP